MTKQIWGNLPVNDVNKTIEFYTKLDFKVGENHFDGNHIASITVGDSNFVICFFPKAPFKAALNGEVADTAQGNEVIFTLSAESKAEVDEWAAKVKSIGGTVFSEPQALHGMYGCGFADVDGHKFNVLFMG
jgi:predicted lactoylglutathione lyase